jgi:regulator of sigma E protease
VTYVVSFLFVLGVLVFIHELGHFLAARRVGIRVLTFSLGFGPKLVKVQRGDTEYCISALPLGGYVKMAGEAADEPRTGAPDEFLSKTKWQRFQVLIMGPVMNILLAIFVLAFVLARGNQVPRYLDQPAVVGMVTANSPAEKAGVQPGDRIVEVEGDKTDTWDALEVAVGTRSGRDIAVTFERMGERRTVRMHAMPQGKYEFGDIGVEPDVYPLVAQAVPGDPADKAGVKAGDVVRAVDGVRMVFPEDLRDAISKKAGVPVDLTIARNGVEQHIRVTPVNRDGGGKIGVVPTEPTKLVELGPLAAFRESLKVNYESTGLIFRTLGGLFTGQNSLRQLQGPIRIAQMSGEAAQISIISLLRFMAMLSLNLGLLNLLPVPILDGGHILIMAIEGIARRDFSMQVKERMLMAGFVVLMMLMVTVFYNDLAGIGAVQHLMKWRN